VRDLEAASTVDVHHEARDWLAAAVLRMLLVEVTVAVVERGEVGEGLQAGIRPTRG